MNPADQSERKRRALRALEGLSVGDAFGELFFRPDKAAGWLFARQVDAAAPWCWTDDTAMAIAVVETLVARGRVDSADFADRLLKQYLPAC